jgi:peptidyl-prolyl cis-trans isomerase C
MSPALAQARELLLRRARLLDLIDAAGDEDAALEALIEREVKTPQPTEEECRRYYERNAAKFRAGELVEASHILFALTARVPPGALRAKAAEVHAVAAQDLGRFAELAARYSNCPSAGQGGSLGQLGRGDAVPEFEAALFGDRRLGLLPDLVTSRHGFHVVLVARRVEGRVVPFEAVHEVIGERLSEHALERALFQYLQVLGGADSPLVQ